MHRELTVERRGDLYHLRFHDFMGPWEGHRLEALLELEEVPVPAGDEPVPELAANQSCLLRPMDFEPELVALVTEDRLPRVAQIVRDRHVEVVEGASLLPDPPVDHVPFVEAPEPVEESYVARIEASHRPVWQRGPKAIAGAVLLRGVPLLLVVYVAIVIGRHTGDVYEPVTLGQMFTRAQAPRVQQGTWGRWTSPDRSDHVQHSVRRVLYAHGPYMIVGDGHFLAFDGAKDVMPWLDFVRMASSPLVIEAQAADGTVHVNTVRCGSQVLATDLGLRSIARLAASGTPPRRDATGDAGTFRPMDTLSVARDTDDTSLRGEALCLEGRVVDEDGVTVLRMANGTGVELDLGRAGPVVARFLEAMTGLDCPIQVDLVMHEVFPWNDGARGRLRTEQSMLGVADVYSASARNYTVVGRRLVAS